MRPIFQGEWTQAHIDWFMGKFQNHTKEIDAREVQRAFGSRKGDGFPGSSESKSEEFRFLMRLIVHHKLARVTQGFSGSTDYRIIIVSESHPYVEKVFDDDIFLHPRILNPLGDCVAAIFKGAILAGQYEHEKYKKMARLEHASRLFEGAFRYYQYGGGDMENVFHFHQFKVEAVEGYVLLAFELIYMYKIIKIACKKLPEEKLFTYKLHDYNEMFSFVFYCKFASELLAVDESKNKHSESYTNRNLREILTSFVTNMDIPKQRVKNMMKTVSKALDIDDENLSSRDFVHCAASGAWLMEMTENSGDRDVEKARADWILRFEFLVEYGIKR
jgi:hypothetical protein